MINTKQAFIEWLQDKKKPDGSSYYKDGTIRQYIHPLKNKLARYRPDESIKSNLFEYDDAEEFKLVRQKLLNSPSFLADIANPDKGDFSDHKRGMGLYEEFLSEHSMKNPTPQSWIHSPGSTAINQTALAGMQKAMGQVHAGFKSFTDPGESYLKDERMYKDELHSIFQQELFPLLASDKDEDVAAIHGVFMGLLSRKLAGSGNRPQNLISWRTIDYIPKLDAEGLRAVGHLYQKLLNEELPLRDRLDAFAEEYPAKADQQKISWQGHMRAISSFMLAFAYPEKYIFVRANVFKDASMLLLGQNICADYSAKRISLGEEYEIIMGFSAAVKAALGNWQPKDYIDIQSFLWVGTQMGTTEPEQDKGFNEISTAIAATGLRLSESILRRYHISLKTRGFVILAGVSGTGKTWLAQAYAEAVGARSLVVPVAPNWNSNEDLLGHYNPFSRSFCPTEFTTFLEEAAADENGTEYHLILDEMNLARVEHYFAKFLSAMELRQRDKVVQLHLGGEKSVSMPKSLKFIGTVNIDETTHGFADKVYDRAQLIELPLDRELLAGHIAGQPFAPLLMEIWDAVRRAAPFAFRVLDEINAYVAEAVSSGVNWRTAIDEMTVQKVMPRLKGHDSGLDDALVKLKEIAEANSMPLVAEKADYMRMQFNEYGFTSFFQK